MGEKPLPEFGGMTTSEVHAAGIREHSRLLREQRPASRVDEEALERATLALGRFVAGTGLDLDEEAVVDMVGIVLRASGASAEGPKEGGRLVESQEFLDEHLGSPVQEREGLTGEDDGLVFLTPDEMKGTEWAIGRGLREARAEAAAWPHLKDNVKILESARSKVQAKLRALASERGGRTDG